MGRIVAFMVFVWLLTTNSAFAQFAYLPHVPRSDGGFETALWLVRTQPAETSAFTLSGFSTSGDETTSTAIQLAVGESARVLLSEIFESGDIAWLRFDADAGVVVTIEYKAQGAEKGTAQSHQDAATSTRWRIYAGENSLVWDGVALVNPNDEASSFVYEAFDEAGKSIGIISPFAPLMPLAKDLHLLSDSFPDAAYYEISSQLPLLVTSLRGDQGGSDRLWVNPAVSLAQDSL